MWNDTTGTSWGRSFKAAGPLGQAPCRGLCCVWSLWMRSFLDTQGAFSIFISFFFKEEEITWAYFYIFFFTWWCFYLKLKQREKWVLEDTQAPKILKWISSNLLGIGSAEVVQESINPSHQIVLWGRESTNHHRAPSPDGLWYGGCSWFKAEPLFWKKQKSCSVSCGIPRFKLWLTDILHLTKHLHTL